MDGNFKAEHLHPSNPADQVSLMDGLGFIVADHYYKQHLATTEEHAHHSQCNNHSSGKHDFAIIGLGLQKIPTNSSQ